MSLQSQKVPHVTALGSRRDFQVCHSGYGDSNCQPRGPTLPSHKGSPPPTACLPGTAGSTHRGAELGNLPLTNYRPSAMKICSPCS